MKVMYAETTYDMSANLTGSAQYRQSNDQLPKTTHLPAALGGSSVVVVVVLVCIVAVLYRRRYKRAQMAQLKQPILVSSSTAEDVEYETIPYNTGFGGISFSDKVNLSQMIPGGKGNLHVFTSNTTHVINTNTSSGQKSVNTNSPIILNISKGVNMKDKERHEISINNCAHKSIELEDDQIRNTADLNSKPDSLNCTSRHSNEYANFSGGMTTDTILYDATAESYDDLYVNCENLDDVDWTSVSQSEDYANCENSDDVDWTSVSQSEDYVQECRQKGMCMNSERALMVTGQRQSHDASVNVVECPHGIYVNNKRLQKLAVNANSEHESPGNEAMPDELYTNFNKVNTHEENVTKIEQNHCMDNKESSLNTKYLNVHHNDSNGQESAHSNNTPTKIRKRNDYQNAHIDQLGKDGTASNIPDTTGFVASMFEVADAYEYSTIEVDSSFQTRDEQDGTSHSVYSRLREDPSCVVNLYGSFS